MLINRLSNEVKSSYDVILGICVKAHQHWHWAREIFELLKRNKNLYDKSTWFLEDTRQAHHAYAAQCLMNLYEKENEAFGIGTFLNKLKNELHQLVVSDNSAQIYLDLIEDDLRSLKKKPLKDRRRRLMFLRNKKYSHIDPDNAAGQLSMEISTGKVAELTPEEIETLLTKIKNIISQYGELFNKPFQNYLNSSTVVKDAINKLEHVFFQNGFTIISSSV